MILMGLTYFFFLQFCIMRKLVQCGKYFRSLALPPYTSFTVLVWGTLQVILIYGKLYTLDIWCTHLQNLFCHTDSHGQSVFLWASRETFLCWYIWHGQSMLYYCKLQAGLFLIITILDIIHVQVFYLKHNISKTGSYLCLQNQHNAKQQWS
jgi:hypothetical protein